MFEQTKTFSCFKLLAFGSAPRAWETSHGADCSACMSLERSEGDALRMKAMEGSLVWVDGTHFSAQSVAIIVVLLDLEATGVVSEERAVWEVACE